jgi:hypothetical protein
MNHIRQTTSYSCGACSYAMIVGITEKEAIKEVKTKSSDGTSTYNVELALACRKINFKTIEVNQNFESVFTHLKLLSRDYSLYVCGHYESNSGRGRNRRREHAIVIKNGFIYDPGEMIPVPINAYGHTYNRLYLIKKIILVGFPS